MFAAGGLLWANMRKPWFYEVGYVSYDPVIEKFWITGWPFKCVTYSPPNGVVRTLTPRIARYDGPAICANIIVGISSLVMITFISERLMIRRREARKP